MSQIARSRVWKRWCSEHVHSTKQTKSPKQSKITSQTLPVNSNPRSSAIIAPIGYPRNEGGIAFASPPALGTFPAKGQPPIPAQGSASITVLGTQFPATPEFFFLAGADPYFTNVQRNPSLGPGNQEAPWLSQDLRVFTATPGQPGNQIPVPSPQYIAPPQSPLPPGAPSFVENNAYGDYDIQGAYNYITSLIGHLNKYYGDPSKVDPFDVSNSILPGQLTAYTGDSSVAPGTNANMTTYNNYNFAVARVRLQGTAGSAGAASGVKVFFRLWQTQTADTDWSL